MDYNKNEIEASVFRKLVTHLQENTEVQNIDLMDLAGFCRNCLGKWYKAAAEEMVRAEKGGAIINMSSIQALVTSPETLSYAICKGGISQLTKASALALASHRIRVNAIAPGSINTSMFQAGVLTSQAYKTVMSRTPIGRPGEPHEIARIAVFLASNDSSYITGETIVADGGRMSLNYIV